MADDANELASDLRAFAEQLQSQKLLNRLGLGAIRLIKTRTRLGIDVDGRPFPSATDAKDGPYSRSHKRKREKRGLPTSIKNLEFSLHDGMLQKVDHVVSADFTSVSVLIDDPKKALIARYLNDDGAGKNKMKHRFWELNLEEEAKLQTLADAHVAELLTLNRLS